MVRWLPALATLIAVLCAGCASPQLPALTLQPAHAYVEGERADTLDLGGTGEVFIRPRLLVTGFDGFPLTQEELRLQVLLRIVLDNGGVITWPLGADGDAPRSEGGRRWRPTERDGLSGIALGGARLGPLAVEQLKAIEVFAVWLRAPAQEHPRGQGALAMGSAPEIGAPAESWAAAGLELERLNAAPLLVGRVPVSRLRARSSGEHAVRLALLTTGVAGSAPELLRLSVRGEGEDGPWPSSLADSDVSVVILDLNLQVQPDRP